MNTAIMPMPGALRWRALHPLIDEGGACSLIYDLERASVLEVPEELQLHVAPALETGDPDDDLLSWLVRDTRVLSLDAKRLRRVPFYPLREPAVRLVAGWYQLLDAIGR